MDHLTATPATCCFSYPRPSRLASTLVSAYMWVRLGIVWGCFGMNKHPSVRYEED